MALTSGTRLGPYEILSAIGAGGMGEVYRARDTKLGRDVAIKVLPEAVATDPERLARFHREAQVLASLNHPNIAHIHGYEESGGVHALVMELVEGPTLADILHNSQVSSLKSQQASVESSNLRLQSSGALPVTEALNIARQIAEALEAAHEQGVIHRDLKPANIKVREDGTVKVLDFGLAKMLDPVSAEGRGQRADAQLTASPTITSPAMMTGVGVILGTAAYMSPEQARGKPVDKRTDVWAFGCVLFEMLTGARPFEGSDVTDVIAAVVRAEVDWQKLPPDTPRVIRRLLRRCLAKDKQERLPDMGTARLDIKDAATGEADESSVATTAGDRATAKARLSRYAWIAAAVLLISTLVLGAMLYLRPASVDPLTTRFVINPPDGWTFAPGGRPAQGGLGPIVLSPSGRHVVFVGVNLSGATTLWVRPLDAVAATMLPGTDGASNPFWSPDSRSIAFFAAGKIKKVDLSGGPPVTVCDVPNVVFETQGISGALPTLVGNWTRDGAVLFTTGAGTGANAPILTVSAAGGTAKPAGTLDGRVDFLPDGRHFFQRRLVPGTSAAVFTATIGVVGSIENKVALERLDTGPILYSDGYVFFLRERVLMAQPFDAGRLEINGEPVAIAEDISNGTLTPGSGIFSVSQSGVLAYRTNPPPVDSKLIWVDRDGKQTGVLADHGAFSQIELAPDGGQVAVSIVDRPTRTTQLWVYDAARAGVRSRLSRTSGEWPVWSPDGSRIVFRVSDQPGETSVAERVLSGTSAERIFLRDADSKTPTSWSLDGLLFSRSSSFVSQPTNFVNNGVNTGGTGDLWLLSMGAEPKTTPILQTPAAERFARFSPDGRWISFVSNDSGRDEVYVMPYGRPGARVPLSAGGGTLPRWRRDGREIFYVGADDRLMAAEVTVTDARVDVGAVRSLFVTKPAVGIRYFYDVSADGQRFLVNTIDSEPVPAPVTVVVNWRALLNQSGNGRPQ